VVVERDLAGLERVVMGWLPWLALLRIAANPSAPLKTDRPCR